MTIDKNRQQMLKAYREKQNRIARLVQGIQKKLEADARQQNINWASVGSLGHVEELLERIDEFLD